MLPFCLLMQQRNGMEFTIYCKWIVTTTVLLCVTQFGVGGSNMYHKPCFEADAISNIFYDACATFFEENISTRNVTRPFSIPPEWYDKVSLISSKTAGLELPCPSCISTYNSEWLVAASVNPFCVWNVQQPSGESLQICSSLNETYSTVQCICMNMTMSSGNITAFQILIKLRPPDNYCCAGRPVFAQMYGSNEDNFKIISKACAYTSTGLSFQSTMFTSIPSTSLSSKIPSTSPSKLKERQEAQMSSTGEDVIIGAVVGCGGGLLLAIILAIAIILCKRSRYANPSETTSNLPHAYYSNGNFSSEQPVAVGFYDSLEAASAQPPPYDTIMKVSEQPPAYATVIKVSAQAVPPYAKVVKDGVTTTTESPATGYDNNDFHGRSHGELSHV